MSPTSRLPTEPEMVILSLLRGRRGNEMYGREMVAKDSRLGENWIYVVLARMVACGYLAARQETSEEKQGRGGPKRRLYKATGFGNRMFAARIQSDATAALRFQALNTGWLRNIVPTTPTASRVRRARTHAAPRTSTNKRLNRAPRSPSSKRNP